jgi:radical SAM superfamily enzyme YgiQ (UPF0313 family)
MRIALIAPCKEDQRWKGEKSRFVWPPMGLLTLASMLPPDWDVRLYDEAVERLDPLPEADLALVSVLTANAPRGYEIADRLRDRGIPVVIGGIHASALPHEAGAHADAVFVGEAEAGFQKVLADFQGGRGLSALYRAEGFCDPACIPVPRRDLLRPRAYGVPCTVMATRGCPYNCSFCSTTRFMGNRYRLRPVEAVTREIGDLSRRWFIFLDDNLFARRSYARALMEGMLPLRKRWVAQTSMNVAQDPDLLSLARAAGCMGLLIGFESLSEENLQDVRKGVNQVEKYKAAVHAIRRAGIFVQGSFIFGFDRDPSDIFERTFRFVMDASLEGANYSILTPLPGTDLFERLDAEGRVTERDWSRFDKLNVCFRPRNIAPERLVAEVKRLYRRTYSIGSILRRVPLFRRQSPMALLYNLAYRRGVFRRWD